MKEINCHHGIIYEVCWSSDDEVVLSVSADTTAVYWCLRNDDIKIVSHPSYVYCGKICPVQVDFIVTGCWDQVLRLWWKRNKEMELLEELDGHEGYITAVCFTTGSQFCLSGDSLGKLRIWRINLHPKKLASFECIRICDLGDNISLLQPHASGRKVLIQTRNSRMSLFDLRSCLVISSFTGLLNFKEVVKGTLCTCGDFVFSGSEDSCLYVWNSHTSDLIGVYSNLPYTHTISSVTYHPFDHYLAVGACNDHAPVIILKFSSLEKSIISFVSSESKTDQKSIETKYSLWSNLRTKVVTRDTKSSHKIILASDQYSEKFTRLVNKLDSVLQEARKTAVMKDLKQPNSLPLNTDNSNNIGLNTFAHAKTYIDVPKTFNVTSSNEIQISSPNSNVHKKDRHTVMSDSECYYKDSHVVLSDSECYNKDSHAILSDSECYNKDSQAILSDSEYYNKEIHVVPSNWKSLDNEMNVLAVTSKSKSLVGSPHASSESEKVNTFRDISSLKESSNSETINETFTRTDNSKDGSLQTNACDKRQKQIMVNSIHHLNEVTSKDKQKLSPFVSPRTPKRTSATEFVNEALHDIQSSMENLRRESSLKVDEHQSNNAPTDETIFAKPILKPERRRERTRPSSVSASSDSDDAERKRRPPAITPRKKKDAKRVPDMPLNRVKARYKFIAENHNELGFGKGETLEVLSEDLKTWLLARNLDGKEGYIPANYVRRID